MYTDTQYGTGNILRTSISQEANNLLKKALMSALVLGITACGGGGGGEASPEAQSSNNVVDQPVTDVVDDQPVTNTDNVKILRVNAGGQDYTDAKGQTWSADYGFNLGSTSTRTNAINGTEDDALYQTERWHSGWKDVSSAELSYRFTVPAADYVVKLHFAEISKLVSRVFDVEIEGTRVLEDFNIQDVAGQYTVLIKSFNTTVRDGELNIRFPRGSRSPQISAIEIIPVASQKAVSAKNTDPLNILVPEAVSDKGTLSLISAPANGSAVVKGRRITYTANSGFSGEETIVYQFVDNKGATTISSITVTVTCTTCNKAKKDAVVTLSWQPNTESINGYKVFYGPDAANANELKTTIALNSGQVNVSAPQVSYKATSDLNYYPGEQVCFRVQAYSDSKTSAMSTPVCGTI